MLLFYITTMLRHISHLCFYLGLAILFSQCQTSKKAVQQLGEGISIQQLSAHLYVHVSYITLSNGSTYPCNGLVYINKGEAMIFDTPLDDASSQALMDWLQKEKKVKIKGVVVNHFHEDCLGTLALFHKAGIPSYANSTTQDLAKAEGFTVPTNGFDQTTQLQVGGESVECWHPGEAHTVDNIVAWISTERTLFGGCMLKSVGATKGNLADANVATWSTSIQQVKTKYPNLKWAIPGHGDSGGMELLDFTIDLFKPEN